MTDKFLIIVILLFVIAAGAGYVLLDGSMLSEKPTHTNGDNAATGGTLFVDTVEIAVLESFPVQIRATVSGNASDACTTVGSATVSRDGDTFIISLTPDRPDDALCAQVLTPFTETVSLDVYGLSAGEYTVKAGDATATFELEVDNLPPEQKG